MENECLLFGTKIVYKIQTIKLCWTRYGQIENRTSKKCCDAVKRYVNMFINICVIASVWLVHSFVYFVGISSAFRNKNGKPGFMLCKKAIFITFGFRLNWRLLNFSDSHTMTFSIKFDSFKILYLIAKSACNKTKPK